MPEHSTLLAKLDWAQEFLRSGHGLALSAAGPMARTRMWSAGGWFASLFMRDGRAMEFFSGVGLFGWAWLTDAVTDTHLVPASLGAAQALMSPDAMVWAGYALGAGQVAALATLRRTLRAPISIAVAAFVGVLTAGVWESAVVPPGGTAFYLVAWGMNVYVFIRLCSPRA